MAISYNLTFRKMNLSGRVLLEKEGEVVLHARGFHLKGKGAYDKGELIHFSDIQNVSISREALEFTTFFQCRFSLVNFSNLFDQFLMDFTRARNDFLIEALFLKQGKLLKQFDGHFERTDSKNTLENDDMHEKGQTKIRLCEQSLILIPAQHEAFSFPFSFLKYYEFDEDEYTLKIENEDGVSVVISQLGNDFEEFEEQFNQALTVMYSEILKQFQNFFLAHKPDKLVKVANSMKYGKAVSMKELQKIDKDLSEAIEKAVFHDEIFLQTIEPLKKKLGAENFFIGLSMLDGKKDHYFFSVMMAIPEQNILTCTIGSYDDDLRKVQDTYFFKLADRPEMAADCVSQRVLDLNQALVLLHFSPEAFYKDKKELQKSLYKLAIKKLPFLERLRRMFLGRCPSILPDLFERNFQKYQREAGERRSGDQEIRS